jgi:hypothetical protein
MLTTVFRFKQIEETSKQIEVRRKKSELAPKDHSELVSAATAFALFNLTVSERGCGVLTRLHLRSMAYSRRGSWTR